MVGQQHPDRYPSRASARRQARARGRNRAARAPWAGGRPLQLGAGDEDFVVANATTRPTKLGQPFTRWSSRKLVIYVDRIHGRVIQTGRNALRGMLARRGITVQRNQDVAYVRSSMGAVAWRDPVYRYACRRGG